ncbi:MAG: adenylate/guanylate cyclase domain-containing protein [Sporichthyaceae bacterium]
MLGPDVRYARSGDLSIAYATVGGGPFDIVFVSGWVLSNLEVSWETSAARWYEELGSIGRLIIFDKRGSGLSDRVSGVPDLQTRMDDVRAVMDAVGSRRAAVVGASEGGPMATLFAASYPERVAALVLYGSLATFTRAPDYPWADTRAELMAWIEDADRSGLRLTDEWCDDWLRGSNPTIARDEKERYLFRRWARASGSPATLSALSRMNAEIDVRHVLPAVRVPTLVLHRSDDIDVEAAHGRYLADKIPGARLVLVDGVDHGWWVQPEQLTVHIKQFLVGLWQEGGWDAIEPDRVLATVLFTDIVDSTARLAELGDRRWGEVLSEHHRLVRGQLARFGGREVDTAGDGFFATFDGPARAIRCAQQISEAVQGLGLSLRLGLHTGECELTDGKVSGIAVHIGARVAAQAHPGEVLVSRTVKDLVAGSGLSFEQRGSVELKGVPGSWELFALVRTG